MDYNGLLQFFLGSGHCLSRFLLTRFMLTGAISIYKFPPSWIPAEVAGLIQSLKSTAISFRYAKETVSNSNFGGRKEAIRTRKTILILKH